MNEAILAVRMLADAAVFSAAQAGLRLEGGLRPERFSVSLKFDDPAHDEARVSIPPGLANFVASCYPGREIEVSKIEVGVASTDAPSFFRYSPSVVEFAVRPRIISSQNSDLPEEETTPASSVTNRLNTGLTDLSFPGFIHIVTGDSPVKYGISRVSMRTILAAGGTGFNYSGMREMTEPQVLGELAGYLIQPESARLPLSEGQRRCQPKREVTITSGF